MFNKISYTLSVDAMSQEDWDKTFGKTRAKPKEFGAGTMATLQESGHLPCHFPLQRLRDVEHYWPIIWSDLTSAFVRGTTLQCACTADQYLDFSKGTTGNTRTPVWFKLVEQSAGTATAPTVAQRHPTLPDVYMIPSPWQAKTIFGEATVHRPKKASSKFPVARYVFKDSLDEDKLVATVITGLSLNSLLEPRSGFVPTKILPVSNDLWTSN